MKLKIVTLHITGFCKDHCPFCYLSSNHKAIHPPFRQIEKIICELSERDIEEIWFVGGDPCSYPDLIPALRLSHDLGMKNTVISNTLDFKQRIREVINYVNSFEATILGASSREHDQVTQRKGSYEELVRNIKNINEEGLGVGILFNATSSTFNKLYDTVDNLLINVGISIRYVVIQRIIPQGRASNTLEYTLSYSQIGNLLKDVERIHVDFKLPVTFEDPFPLCIVDDRYHKFLSRCEWGFSKGAINYQGDISRCGADPRYQLGNIFKTDLQLLWNNSPILQSFRSYKWLPERCQKCSLLGKCGGGCPLSRITERDHVVDVLFPYDI